jgi:hypothetical protein
LWRQLHPFYSRTPGASAPMRAPRPILERPSLVRPKRSQFGKAAAFLGQVSNLQDGAVSSFRHGVASGLNVPNLPVSAMTLPASVVFPELLADLL